MRTTIEIHNPGAFDFRSLRAETDLLYRRVADRDRAVLAIGVHHIVQEPEFNSEGHVKDWVFGVLPYEWEGGVDARSHGQPEPAAKDPARWFVPQLVVEWVGERVRLHALPGQEEQAGIWARSLFLTTPADQADAPIGWKEGSSRTDYLANAQQLLAHIQRGDIYEVNYCTARSATASTFDPFSAFNRMLDRSQAPFAAFYRNRDSYALCASPERFLAFHGSKVMGQPMKGTRPRSMDPQEDLRLAQELAHDGKERSENIMALDVMRNDLSRVAASGSVKVDELCAVVSFPKVHQMISTVSARLREGSTPLDAIRAAFPMASMTGAPKIRAMQLIHAAEEGPRGLFSGSLGFFAPDGTADFNVVIRSVFFNDRTKLLSMWTGSAITAQCRPEDEWDECQLKARSVIDALRHELA